VIKILVLVPVADNTGAPFPESAWLAFEARLLAFGGFSVRADVAGVWQAEGRTYRDRSREYTVSLSSWWAPPDWLAAVDWARDHFRQLALYVEVAGIPEIREG